MKTEITLPHTELKVSFGKFENDVPWLTIVNSDKEQLTYISDTDIKLLREFLNQLEL